MKTQIVLNKEQKILKEFDKFFCMSPEDGIDLEGDEYIVEFCNLKADSMIMQIFVRLD